MELPLRATVRLQIHKAFDLRAAKAQVPYYARLGISHYYLSPIHTARAGSPHGYNVVDFGSIGSEIGGEDALRELVAELRRHQMGVIVDLVPNHMAIGGSDNRAWLDLLEWGIHSRYATFFDVDWDVQDPVLRQKIHAPFLGKPYGDALADGELRLHFDKQEGRLFVAYYDHRFPISPRHYAGILGKGDTLLAAYAETFSGVSPNVERREQTFEQARLALADAIAKEPKILSSIEERLKDFDPQSATGRNALHQLLERQHYRLAWWRTANDEINWRRFFDVIELAGLRMQEPTAFSVVHANTFRLYQEGLIDGVRIDHVDGLADPRTYCRRLRRALSKLNHLRPESAPQGKPVIYVEKILAPGERLSKEWQVDGDTGYAFMNEVGALLNDPDGEKPLGEAWAEITGQPPDFEVEEKAARRRTVQTLLAADFNACALALHQIARSNSHSRDWTLAAIRRVLTEILVEFPVYRTYVDARGRSVEDEAIMAATLAAAKRRCQPADRDLVDVIDAWLGGEAPLRVKPVRAQRARLRAIARFQQLSSPVAAKSVEDTAFYRYGHLLSRNEVGSTPAQFYISAEDFHVAARLRQRRYPICLLATATHDHKRGEDLRARLAVLSELPQTWFEQVGHWREINAQFKSDLEGRRVPDGADEYMLYQMLMGAWPIDMSTDNADALNAFKERISQWQEKALREAKRNSNWIEPDTGYEEKARNFLDALLDPERGRDFLASMETFVNSIACASAINSLTQVLIKMTAPGVPDFYQGCELWDLSFVDPDNRRPVDYDLRQTLFEEFSPQGNQEEEQPKQLPDWPRLLQEWRNGAIKQQIIHRLLSYRAAQPDLFTRGTYYPLRPTGPLYRHVFCYMREYQSQIILVAVVRFPSSIAEKDRPFISPSQWRDTGVALPPRLRGLRWQNIFTDEIISADYIDAANMFSQLTVCALKLVN